MTNNCTISIQKFTEILPTPTAIKVTVPKEHTYHQSYNLNTLVNKIIQLKYTYYTDNKIVHVEIPQFSFTFNGLGVIRIPIKINNSILYPKTSEIKTVNMNNNVIIYMINSKTNHIDILIRKDSTNTTVVVPKETLTYTSI